MTDFPDLHAAIQILPGQRWAVGVSGGADSVALLRLLHGNGADLKLHVVHLDHQTRGDQSTADASFVAELAGSLGLPVTCARRADIEHELPDGSPNPSAHYRMLRHELFRRVVTCHALDGVLLAHHADDVAETVLHRLLRGSGLPGLTGIAPRVTIGDLMIVRPLLTVRRDRLRMYLGELGQPWREDASNDSAAYFRNRLRQILASNPHLYDGLHSLGSACTEVRHWVRTNAAVPAVQASVYDFAGPRILARESARRWLAARGVPVEELTPAVIDRLLDMVGDAATPSKQQFPGNVTIRRQRGMLRRMSD